MQAGARRLADEDPKNFIPFVSPRVATQDRYEDEPAPTADDMIKVHYLKHHPFYEFRDFEDLHVDPYRYWLHQRVDYLNTETYPGEVNPWERGSKVGHMFYVLLPFLSLIFVSKGYKTHLRQKNVKMPIVGVFSQCSV